LGFWSLGDYWKKEAIEYTFEFLTEELGIDAKNLAITCFEGDPTKDIPRDTESADIWKTIGFSGERIAFLGYEDNWWGPAGMTGPCGPDTEIFVWTGEGEAPEKYEPSDDRWVEICNDVFMQYNKTVDGKFETLAQKNVDFGGGMERILAYLEGRDNVFETDLFEPILKEIEKISGKKYGFSSPVISSEVERSFRIITDHIKAATFIISDGVIPSNKDRGYVLRRLIRRAIVKGHQLGISENFTTKIAEKVFEIYEGVYFTDSGVISTPLKERVEKSSEKDLSTNARDDKKPMILSELEKEENKFRRTLAEGLKLIESLTQISAKNLFDLYQSFGIPFEISVEEAKRRNIEINNETIEQFNDLVTKHKELSRTASAGMFKGGLADAGEETTRLHTAAHLLLQALRQVLGEGIYQKGSNITAERLRFDFSHPEKMTPEQVEKVEKIVNEKIAEDLSVTMEEMTLEEAKKSGAMGVFESKYGEKVKVYSIGQFSNEICGGPHVTHTGILGHFKIQKEESSSAGVRRIKAILE